MVFERVMGIYVSDDEEYQRYREGMIPILHSFGGSFGFDFKVSEVGSGSNLLLIMNVHTEFDFVNQQTNNNIMHFF